MCTCPLACKAFRSPHAGKRKPVKDRENINLIKFTLQPFPAQLPQRTPPRNAFPTSVFFVSRLSRAFCSFSFAVSSGHPGIGYMESIYLKIHGKLLCAKENTIVEVTDVARNIFHVMESGMEGDV